MTHTDTAHTHGLTAGQLIAALSGIPPNTLVLVDASGATDHVMVATDVDEYETGDVLDIEDPDELVRLHAGEYVAISAVEVPYLGYLDASA